MCAQPAADNCSQAMACLNGQSAVTVERPVTVSPVNKFSATEFRAALQANPFGFAKIQAGMVFGHVGQVADEFSRDVRADVGVVLFSTVRSLRWWLSLVGRHHAAGARGRPGGRRLPPPAYPGSQAGRPGSARAAAGRPR